MELVLKTSDPARDRGFESHPLRHHLLLLMVSINHTVNFIGFFIRSGTQAAEEDGLLNR